MIWGIPAYPVPSLLDCDRPVDLPEIHPVYRGESLVLGHHLVVAQGHVPSNHVQSSVPEDLLEAEYVSSID